MADTKDAVSTFVRTLLVSGFELNNVERFRNHAVVTAHRIDELKAQTNYAFLLADEPGADVVEPFLRDAEGAASPIVVGQLAAPPDGVSVWKPKEFYKALGGRVHEIVHRDDITTVLNELGHNRLPASERGSPEDLLEEYAKQCIQFATGERSRRYGQDRSGEKVPDGIVLGDAVLLFDGKAYGGGYSISADDVRRFADYVTDFNGRYQEYIGRVFAFCIVTGSFNQDDQNLQDKRDEFYARCETQLCCLEASTLGEITLLLRANYAARAAINWRSIFSRLKVRKADVIRELTRISKDGI